MSGWSTKKVIAMSPGKYGNWNIDEQSFTVDGLVTFYTVIIC